jgi:hypothetical protein
VGLYAQLLLLALALHRSAALGNCILQQAPDLDYEVGEVLEVAP